MRGRLRAWAALSLIGYLAFLGATWDWFDADEFVNLQQAIRSSEGERLYVSTPSNHPPLYTEIFLRPLLALPGPDLLIARLVSVGCAWGAGVIVADLFRRLNGVHAARTFLVLWTINGFALTTGTRAMNEVPLLLLLAYAAHVTLLRRTVSMAGAAAAAAILVRLTAVFYLPALLPRDRTRALHIALGGAASLAVVLVPFLLLRPEQADGFFRWAIAFHAQRADEDWARRIGKTLWWSGLPLLAVLASSLGVDRRPIGRAVSMGAAAIVGACLMVFLPSVHVHYFLPCALVVTAAVAALGVRWSGLRLGGLVAGFLVVTASQGVLYVPMTPHHDLARAERVADWIEGHTPSDALILSDAPQYALLAQRDNWGGYYWSLRDAFTQDQFVSALNESTIVVVSQRFGHYDRGFPSSVLAMLDPLPCMRVEDVRVHWTGSGGIEPADFVDDC